MESVSTELLMEWNLIGCGCPEVLNDKTKILASGLESSSLQRSDYDIKAVSDDRMPSETERALENILLILECFFNYGVFYVPGIDFYLN